MAQQPSLRELLEVAVEAACAGGKRTLAYFNNSVAVETKSDQTPVTIADREAEGVILSCIRRFFPEHSVLAEETGASAGDPAYRWVIDPLDGTKSFIHGVPLYGTLVAVEVQGIARVGVIYCPALHELLYAASGEGCWWNGRRARVSTVDRLDQATLLTSSFTSCVARSDAWDRLAAATRLQRGWGDCYGYLLVATGRAEIMLDPVMSPWDCGPLQPIMEEAGGFFGDWQGRATIHSKEAVAGNAALREQVLAVLRSEKKRAPVVKPAGSA